MPAKKRSSSGKKEAPKESQAATRRSTRGGSAANDSKSAATSKRKASPSPSPAPKRAASAKKGRTKSPSPPPNERPKRGRSTSKKEEPKPVEKPASRSASNQKGRVTRNVVQEEEVKKSTDSKSRSASRGAKSPAKSKGSAEPKNKTVTPKQKAEAPKLKKETPKQKAATQRGRSTTPKRAKETPKEIAVTPKQKSATPKQKPTPRQKQQTPIKKTEPVAKKTSLKSTPVKGNKPESPPKTTRSRRSRQGVEPDEKVCSEDDIETAEKNTDKTVEDETPEKEKPAEDSVAEAVDESKLEVNKTKEHTKDEPEEIENTEQVEKIEEENEQRKGVEGKNETKDGEQALDNVEKGEESAKEDQEPEKDEQQKDEENENVEAMANENSEEADEEMETADADEVEQVGEEVCEISQLKTVQVVSGSNEGETAESKKAEQTADVEEVKANEDAEMTIDSTAVEIKKADLDKSIVDNVKSSETSLTEKTQVACGKPGDDLVKNDLSEKVEATKESAQGVIDFKKVSGEAVNIQTESNVANDLISAGETDYGSGDQEQPKKVAIVEEISDDDIEEIDTKQNNGAANEDNEDIEEIQFVEQVDKYVENSPTKRKIDDVDTELDDSSPVKKIRISTEEEIQENGSSSQEDIAKDYVVIEMGDVPQANSTEVQSSLPNPIFNRTFIPNPTFSGASDTSKQFSVVSYNMLADCHLFRNDYSFTEAKLLQPEYRLKKVIEELRYLDGDIVCMQEVDPQFFTDQLLPTMRRNTYLESDDYFKTWFFPGTSQRDVSEKDRNIFTRGKYPIYIQFMYLHQGYEGLHKQRADEYYNEGEATFFKNSRFDVVDTAASTFSELLQKELEGIEPAIQEAVKKYTNLPDVVIVAKLRCKNTGREVTIGNVHINWGEMKVPDAQCVQIASAVKEIVSKATGDNFPHIICGDFNSPPMSPGYLVARDGYPSGDETINTLMKIEGLELEDGKKASLVNSLWPAFQHTSSSLRSAYSEAQGYEPEISSYNRVMCDCVDYIFYSSMSLENVGVLQTASKEKVMETGGIPNCYFPSDHVSLKSVLSFK